jgi:hypothetical protein
VFGAKLNRRNVDSHDLVYRSLGLLRVTSAFVVLVYLILCYDVFYSEMAAGFYEAGRFMGFSPLLEIWFPRLKLVCFGSCILLLFGVGGRVNVGITLLAFSLLQYHVYRFYVPLWNYDSHIIFFLAILLVADGQSALAVKCKAPLCSAPVNRAFLSLMQVIVATVYLSSFVAKLASAGGGWFLSGDTTRAAVFDANPSLGVSLLAHRWVFSGASVLVGLFEGFTPLLLLFKSTQRVTALIALGFHLITWLSLGISFWHLWIYFPSLFWCWNVPCRLRLIR